MGFGFSTLTLPPDSRDGCGECLAGQLKTLPLLLADVVNGPRGLKAPSALAGSLPSAPAICWTSIQELWSLRLLLFLLEKLVSSHHVSS